MVMDFAIINTPIGALRIVEEDGYITEIKYVCQTTIHVQTLHDMPQPQHDLPTTNSKPPHNLYKGQNLDLHAQTKVLQHPIQPSIPL